MFESLIGSELPLGAWFLIALVFLGVFIVLAVWTYRFFKSDSFQRFSSKCVPYGLFVFVVISILVFCGLAFVLFAIQYVNSAGRVGGPSMVTIFEALVHLVLFLAAIGQILLVFVIITRFSSDMQEVIMRALAAACGLLIYIGSKTFGLSIPDLAFQALSTSFPVAIGLVGLVIPSFIGVLVAWYVISYLNSRNVLRKIVGMRVLTLMMTFVFFLYCDSYMATLAPERKGELTYLLPNIVFVLSVLLYAIFKYHPTPVGNDHGDFAPPR